MKRRTFPDSIQGAPGLRARIKAWLACFSLPRSLDVADVFYPCRAMQPVRMTCLDIHAWQLRGREHAHRASRRDGP